MAKKFKAAAMLSLVGTIVMIVIYNRLGSGILLSFIITLGTISYHLVMRLCVGTVFQFAMHNNADLSKRWYKVGKREASFYERINIKKWKRRMPTYDNSIFDPKLHSWDEIAQAMCQSELVHETLAILSFVPIAGGIWFGDYPVFIITSVLAAGFDMIFVMMQRFNRQRIIGLMKRRGRDG